MRIFVSFDYDNDRHYKSLLNAWNANSVIPFDFDDGSSEEINSWDIAAIKRALSRKINEADAVLVLVGKYADSRHRNSSAIGYKNWQNYEIAKAKEYGKKLIGVKIDCNNESPEELLCSGAEWARTFSMDSIKKAINRAKYGW